MLMRIKSKIINTKNATIEMRHGSGGKAMQALIQSLFMEAFDNPYLNQQNDQAIVDIPVTQLAITTDTYVISPLFFPGGNIGALAVHGTINDLVVGGAKPLYLTVAFVIEEGFPVKTLKNIITAMAKAAASANVTIVTGDTKVVEKGKGDGIFINTTGVGYVPREVHMSQTVLPGDKIIVNGHIGDHGIAVMSRRENLTFETEVLSDSASLHELTEIMLKENPYIACMRDPTRGGLAATLNEWANQYHVGMLIHENNIPIQPAVQGACELLGLDPLYVANEGKLVAICRSDAAEALLKTMQQHPLGKYASIIGEVVEDVDCFVEMETALGGLRVVDWLSGEQLPRIC